MTSAHRAHLVRTLHTTKINTRPSSASNSGATIGKDGAVSGTGSTHSRGTGGGGSAAITGVCVVPAVVCERCPGSIGGEPDMW